MFRREDPIPAVTVHFLPDIIVIYMYITQGFDIFNMSTPVVKLLYMVCNLRRHYNVSKWIMSRELCLFNVSRRDSISYYRYTGKYRDEWRFPMFEESCGHGQLRIYNTQKQYKYVQWLKK
jgi:hypothetical protein